MSRILVVAVAILVFASGCTPAKKITPAPRRDVEVRPFSMRNPGTTNKEKTQISNKISAAVGKVTNVKRATVVVLGTSAYTGLELKQGLNKVQTEAVETKAASVIRQAEPRIRSVWITTRPDAIRKIDQVRSDLRKDKPSSDYSRKLRLILDQSRLIR